MCYGSKHIWKKIPEYDERFSVSCRGRVRVDKVYRGSRYKPGTILPLYPHKKGGYLQVGVSHPEKGSVRVFVHLLVMKTFVGESNYGEETDHLNGVTSDNRLENLEYVTGTENQRRATINGQRWSKLKKEDVLSIRKKYARGNVTHLTLARKYAVQTSTISKIVNNKTWQYV